MDPRPHATPDRPSAPAAASARASAGAEAAGGTAADRVSEAAPDGIRPGRRTLMAGMAAAMLGGHAALTAQAASAAYPGPGVVTGDVTDVHDPEIIRTTGGTYLLPSTGDGISLRTSTDRTHWTNAGAAFPSGTPWADPYTGGSRHLWAPEIHHANGQYYLWYSASSFGSNRSAIFVATSPTGAAGSWTNRGLVVESFTTDNFNAIDPALVVDTSGTWWLAFGSFWDGIRMIRLDSATGLRSGSEMHTLASRGGGPIEAPTIHRAKNGYYYLFVSFDYCCRGADSTYRVMVGRSTSVTGPYRDRAGTYMTAGGGTEILAGQGSIHGPGHQSVLADADSDVLFYHYYDAAGTPRLGINLLAYDSSGWPYVH